MSRLDGCYCHIKHTGWAQPANAKLPVLQVGGHAWLSNGWETYISGRAVVPAVHTEALAGRSETCRWMSAVQLGFRATGYWLVAMIVVGLWSTNMETSRVADAAGAIWELRIQADRMLLRVTLSPSTKCLSLATAAAPASALRHVTCCENWRNELMNGC